MKSRFTLRNLLVFTAIIAALITLVKLGFFSHQSDGLSRRYGWTSPRDQPFYVYEYSEHERNGKVTRLLFVRELEFPGFPFKPSSFHKSFPQWSQNRLLFENKDLSYTPQSNQAYFFQSGKWVPVKISADELNAIFQSNNADSEIIEAMFEEKLKD